MGLSTMSSYRFIEEMCACHYATYLVRIINLINVEGDSFDDIECTIWVIHLIKPAYESLQCSHNC